MSLKEKDIVKHLHENWNEYFPDLKGCKLEVTHRNSRVDILSSIPVDLHELGLREEDDTLRYTNAAVFVEVKYNSNMRDLIFEVQKHIDFREWYIGVNKCFCMIMVISDDFDSDMAQFMQENDILMYKFSMKNEDLSTFTIKEYNLDCHEIEIEEPVLN